MALGTPVKVLINIVGHDGSEIIWPDLPEPLRRRGHHVQEMIYAAYQLGFAVTPFEAFPVSLGKAGTDQFVVPMIPQADERMPRIMTGNTGVVTGENPKRRPHAVAWDGHKILDPGGLDYGINDFHMETFWLVLKIKSN